MVRVIGRALLCQQTHLGSFLLLWCAIHGSELPEGATKHPPSQIGSRPTADTAFRGGDFAAGDGVAAWIWQSHDPGLGVRAARRRNLALGKETTGGTI